MFSKKTLEEKIAVMQAALEGKFIAITSIYDGKTYVCSGVELDFDWINFDYNIYEEPKTKPCIDWKDVNKEFKYMATDEDGRSYLYKSIPTLRDTVWSTDLAVHAYADAFSSFVPGTCDWKDSLVERPD